MAKPVLPSMVTRLLRLRYEQTPAANDLDEMHLPQSENILTLVSAIRASTDGSWTYTFVTCG
jgi:hypothetical protein